MDKAEISIFRKYYEDSPFVDRYVGDPERAVDVIVPVIHTNELWKANLQSFYREIPIHKLLIGDGGCIDNSIEITREFPRVEVLDHRNFVSLGYSVRKLIEAVETEWFIYIHSDAYLPHGWFDAMLKNQADYDWFGCKMQHTVMVEYDLDYGDRPWAGSQMGRKNAFEKGLEHIDDDYVYRQEDFVFADIVKKAGFKEGKVSDTFHYHQTIRKDSPWARQVKSVSFEMDICQEEQIRTHLTQIKGLVKYLDPDPRFIPGIAENVNCLQELDAMTWPEFIQWVSKTNPVWLPAIKKEAEAQARKRYLNTAIQAARKILKPLRKILK